MAIGESAGLLFKIKADADQAKKELDSVKSHVSGLDASLLKMTGAATVGEAAGQLLGDGIRMIGRAALQAATTIFTLTVNASEYGSELFDASQKTGLAVETLSALKYAAHTSGSSLEQISGSIAKFSVLIGDAKLGNEKAIKTLEQFKITATDLDGALAQAIETITSEADATKQAAAAKALFKDRTGEILPVLKSFEGDLPGLIDKLKELGIQMSEEDAEAADAFGDTLDTLRVQAAALGREFAFELMPMMTSAMESISAAMAANKGAAEEWGRSVVDAINGIGSTMKSVGGVILAHFDMFSSGMASNAAQSGMWANTWIANVNRVMLALATFGTSEAFRYFAGVGEGERLKASRLGGTYGIGGEVNIPSGPSSFPSAGGKGGKGGKGGGAKAEKDTEFEDAEKRQMRILEEYKSGLDGQKALLDLHLAAKLISEREYAEEVGKLKIRELKEEKLTYETIQGFAKITADKKAELEHKIGLIRGKLHTQELENTKDVLEIDLDAIEKTREAEEKLDAERKKLHEAEMERARKLANERAKRAAQAAVDADRKEQARLANKRIGSQRLDGGGTEWEELFTFLQDSQQFRDNSALIAGIEVMRSAFEGLAQAIGQVVNAWVLYGSAGTTFRKVTAQILAGIAQQAAVKAIFELAEGFAALARAFFGDPKASAEAAMHFKSAAIYGTVAGVAAVAGRGVAGNAFNEATGGASGGGGGGNSSDRDRNAFGERFRGFGDQNNPFTRAADRMIQAIMLQEEATTRFMHQFGTASPGDVVMRVAESDPEIFGRANEKYLDESGGRGTERLMRRTGMAT